jgi:hypothetical protein
LSQENQRETAMNRVDYYRATLLGVIIGMSSLTLVYMIGVSLDTKEPEKRQVKNNFEVIDTYKGCDVVQWHYSMLSEYKYFLHCASSQGGTQISQMP